MLPTQRTSFAPEYRAFTGEGEHLNFQCAPWCNQKEKQDQRDQVRFASRQSDIIAWARFYHYDELFGQKKKNECFTFAALFFQCHRKDRHLEIPQLYNCWFFLCCHPVQMCSALFCSSCVPLLPVPAIQCAALHWPDQASVHVCHPSLTHQGMINFGVPDLSG